MPGPGRERCGGTQAGGARRGRHCSGPGRGRQRLAARPPPELGSAWCCASPASNSSGGDVPGRGSQFLTVPLRNLSILKNSPNPELNGERAAVVGRGEETVPGSGF